SSLQPGDSKSTTQQLGDSGRSGVDQAKDSASDAQKKVSDNMPSGGSAQDTGKSYLDQASGMASDAQKKMSENMPQGGNVQDMASDAQKKVSDNMPSGGQAQDTGKTYLDQASEMASNAAKVVSDTLNGTLTMRTRLKRAFADSMPTDASKKISESGNTGSK
ncbi:MAG: hypothetical protein Q9226_009018, partial [Calogaya cf. arnoldii]